jgi:hypothetical protein
MNRRFRRFSQMGEEMSQAELASTYSNIIRLFSA